jgi:hypothetical protein
MASYVVDRTGNAPLSEEDKKEFVIINSLEEVEFK